jgi:archaetidylinositol phosphate synthase
MLREILLTGQARLPLSVVGGGDMAEAFAKRWNNGLFWRLERPALIFLAARMPTGVTPDFLTGVGFGGAIITFAGYALARNHPAWLLVATLGLAVNWFGDSLDGTLARYRHIERPHYGYYLDNALDCLAALLLAAGLAVSGYVRPDLCFLGLAAYTMLSALTFLRASVAGVFQISYAAIGPTETRFAFVLFNVLVFVYPPTRFDVLDMAVGYPDLLSLAWSALMIAAFIISMVSEVQRLAVVEPPKTALNRASSQPTGPATDDHLVAASKSGRR